MNQTGIKLKMLRESKGLKQLDLAKILNKSQRMISKYEKQESELDYETLLKYAEYFHVTTDYLLGRVDDPKEYYISGDALPDVMRPLLRTNIATTIKVDEPDINVTDEEKKHMLEEVLKKADVTESNVNISYLMSLLSEEERKEHMSLYELLEKVGSNKDLMRKLMLEDIEDELKESNLPLEALKELDGFKKYLDNKYKNKGTLKNEDTP